MVKATKVAITTVMLGVSFLAAGQTAQALPAAGLWEKRVAIHSTKEQSPSQRKIGQVRKISQRSDQGTTPLLLHMGGRGYLFDGQYRCELEETLPR